MIRHGCIFTLILCAVFLFFSCSRLMQRAPEKPADPRALELVETLRQVNAGLTTFKGVGKVAIWANGQKSLSERVAWIGAMPAKFRIEVLFSGQPLIKVASDGRRLTYRNATSDAYPHGALRLTETNLGHLISIRVPPEDFMAMLSGRIPISEHDTAKLIERPDHAVLELSKGWQGVVERIVLDRGLTTVRQVEWFDSSGFLHYRLAHEQVRTFGPYRIPGRLIVSSDSGDRFRLDIQQFKPDVPVKASMFVLSPP